MKFFLHFVVLAFLLTACQQISKNSNISGCYRMIIKTDTAIISLNQSGDSVSGSLSYHWKERRSNDGTFQGVINDSLIVAHYTFHSDNNISVKQVVFKIKDTTLLQGYVEQLTKNDTTVFRDISLVIFDTKHPFIKSCE